MASMKHPPGVRGGGVEQGAEQVRAESGGRAEEGDRTVRGESKKERGKEMEENVGEKL